MSRTTFWVRATGVVHSHLSGQDRRYTTYRPLRGIASHERYGPSQALSFKLPTLGAHTPRVGGTR